MHNHYRDKFDIIASILGITNGNEIRQVDILSKANIPHNIFIKYMIALHQYGLTEIEHMQHPSQRTYRITGKGIHNQARNIMFLMHITGAIYVKL